VSTPTAVPSGKLGAALLALLVTFLWSTSWVIIRWGLDDEDDRLPPLTFAGLRYGLAAALLVGWTRTGPRRALHVVERSAWRPLIALGAVMYALTQGAQFVAIDSQPAATTNLFLAMTPLAVAVTSAAVLGEHSTRRQQLGGVVVIGGAAVYFGGDLGATSVGLAAALVCLVSNAAATLLGRAVNRTARHSAVAVTAVSMTAGAVLLIAAGLIVDGVPHLSWSTSAIVAWLAVVNTAFAWTWWNHAQRALTATEAAAINTTMAVQIPLLAWIFLDERLGLPEIVGIAIVIVGVSAMRSARPTTIDQQLRPGSRGVTATR
jgi:drug/metabolite transporter (DMT)-like permease